MESKQKMATDTSSGNGNNNNFKVAIIGGGIIGLHVALGLLHRKIPVTVYEQAQRLEEIGAGMGFNTSSEECMKIIDPRIPVALSEIGIKSSQGLSFVDASNPDEELTLRPEDKMFDIQVPEEGRIFCQRAAFLNKLLSLVPSGCFKLGKRLDAIERDGGSISMKFTDGTTVKTDALIGCDGIKSRVRYILLGEQNPAAVPHYCNESAYRCLADMSKVAPILGNYAKGFTVWMGHGAHVVSYPVANNKYLNVAAFVRAGVSWPDYHKQTVQASKDEIKEVFSKFSPTIRGLVDQLPDEQNRWGVFDTYDHPLQTYAYDSIALAGDAAHGSSPHHGLGACMGVQDALALAFVLEKAAETISKGDFNKSHAISSAFKAYDSVRRERSQFLVTSSRRQGYIVKLEIPEIDSPEKFIKDVTDRLGKIFSIDATLLEKQTLEEYERQLWKGQKG